VELEKFNVIIDSGDRGVSYKIKIKSRTILYGFISIEDIPWTDRMNTTRKRDQEYFNIDKMKDIHIKLEKGTKTTKLKIRGEEDEIICRYIIPHE
jgi:hypothetical protein